MKISTRKLSGMILMLWAVKSSAQVMFAPATNFFGGQAAAVVAADINGDGKVDLISLDSTRSLIVLTNNGRGGFRTNGTYPVNLSLSVAAADLNGDGMMDLICGNRSPSGPATITVFTNNGSGRFVLSSILSGGTRFYSVTATDVNGDGKLDVFGADANSPIGAIFVFTNNGSGGFAVSSTNSVGNDPLSIVSADVNGDGWADLICANYNGKNLSVLTNNGSGGFALASSPGAGNNPISLVASDVNGDGKMDLISANSGGGASGNSLSVLTNNGSGGFPFATTYVVGANPCAVVALDVNGDGKVDLISANFVDNTFSVVTNNGSGGFTLAVTCFVGVNANPRGATAADVNGDGRPDLISANFGNGTLSVLLNIPTLTIKNTSSGVVVSWPSSWTNWALLQNSNLATPNWSGSLGISDDGTNKSLSLPSPIDSQFFRLSCP